MISDHFDVQRFALNQKDKINLTRGLLSPVQTDASLLANNSQHCWMLHVASIRTPCYMLLRVVAQSLKPVKLFSQQLPTFLLFRDRRSVAQQCWIRLHSSSNIVGATHAHYAWFTKTYRLYPSHDALQVPTLLGVVASVCTPLPTRTQKLQTLLAQQCWELLRPFSRSLMLCLPNLHSPVVKTPLILCSSLDRWRPPHVEMCVTGDQESPEFDISTAQDM